MKTVTWAIVATLMSTLASFSEEMPPSEEGIRDAILDPSALSQEQINALNQNDDEQLDVADLVSFLRSGGLSAFPAAFAGYTWVVSASFAASTGKVVPVNYPIALRFEGNDAKAIGAVSTTLPGFDPTAGLFQQPVSGEGEVPGANRSRFSPGVLVPPGVEFSCSETSEQLTLECDFIEISVDTPTNPFKTELQRSWQIVINKSAVFSNELNQGTIIEVTRGCLIDNREISREGTILAAPYGRTDLAPLGQEKR